MTIDDALLSAERLLGRRVNLLHIAERALRRVDGAIERGVKQENVK